MIKSTKYKSLNLTTKERDEINKGKDSKYNTKNNNKTETNI